MDEVCELFVQWMEPPSYWAEDFAPSFSGDPGFYILFAGDVISGPHDTKAEAEAERRYLLRIADREGA